MNNECRRKVFYHCYSWKQTESSDSTLHHLKFLVRYSIFDIHKVGAAFSRENDDNSAIDFIRRQGKKRTVIQGK